MLQDMQAATETGAAQWQPFCDRSSVRCVSDIARTIFIALFKAIFCALFRQKIETKCM